MHSESGNVVHGLTSCDENATLRRRAGRQQVKLEQSDHILLYEYAPVGSGMTTQQGHR